ncbi:MAG TPA: hypothetical protein VF614_16995 [Chthoniobacteraceae bacterium]|jgi:hypothetical protein
MGLLSTEALPERAPIAAVITVQDAQGHIAAHLVVRTDDSMRHYGDAAAAARALEAIARATGKLSDRITIKPR